jgi:adenosylcobinamide kinase/adenosylcobinamide-phosphate guanylyltransferase
MGKIILITGGARSGKSRFAEMLLKNNDDVLYIATGIPFDNEMKDRIAKHRERRNKNWTTVEAYHRLDKIINENTKNRKFILIDCVTLMINNLMLVDNNIDWNSACPEEISKLENSVMSEIESLISAARNFTGRTIIVTNELGMGIVPAEPLGRYYRDIAGRANQIIADAADEVYLLVSGIPVIIKGQQC